MIIYGALIISIIAALVLYFRFKTELWKLIIPFLVSLVLIVVMKVTIEKVQVSSKEYWGSLITRIEYYEEWNEWITQTCTRSCCCDSKGENCGTETYDCSYCQNHSPEWRIITTSGETVEITESEYNEIKKIIGNEKFINLNRHYYTIDGNEYTCTWDNNPQTAIPVTTLHHYENRVKAADQSVFHFEKVSAAEIKQYQLKDYPSITGDYKMTAVLGDSSQDAQLADKKMQYLNGLLGGKKQVRVFVLVFKNQPIEAGLYQEWLWSGANKNEFVVAIGTDNNRNVTWCKPISWTQSEELKVETKNFVQSQKQLDLQSLSDHLLVTIDKSFIRRRFREFDYLTVEPPTWAIVLCYVITLIVNIVVCFFEVRSDD